jgi:N-acetylmuramoyl-L-alanine amidase
MLVETAFISNPREERALRDPRHQLALAGAVMDGVRAYFRTNPPPGTLLANRGRKHIIAQGETLSGIARQYDVNLDALRDHNGLSDSALRAGQLLEIPLASDS